MKYKTKEQENVTMQISVFTPADGVAEYMAMLIPGAALKGFEAQLKGVQQAADGLLAGDLKGAVPLFTRYFVSDAANQQEIYEEIFRQHPLGTEDTAISVLQQSPLCGQKVCLWIWARAEAQAVGFCHNGYRHYFEANLSETSGNSEQQTLTLLHRYEDRLAAWGGRMADHCIRTWFFVRDVDVNYAGVVKGRREEFLRMGMTEHTHYLASTGIQGQYPDPRSLAVLDAYAIEGLDKGQVSFLHASDYLNPTHEYGVTFERGTAVEYGDRKHLFISGTASIDNRGEIVHPGDIAGQTERMLVNIEALLKEGGSGMDDLAQMIVYLRDTADYEVVKSSLDERLPGVPRMIVLAPVCRPGWLIESECIAIKAGGNSKFRKL